MPRRTYKLENRTCPVPVTFSTGAPGHTSQAPRPHGQGIGAVSADASTDRFRGFHAPETTRGVSKASISVSMCRGQDGVCQKAGSIRLRNIVLRVRRYCGSRVLTLSQLASRKIPVEPRLIPVGGRGQLAVKLLPRLLFADPELERVESIDDFAHQLAHLVIADPAHFRPRDPPACRSGDSDIGKIVGVTDGARTGMQVFESGVGHTDQRPGFCHD